MKYLTSKNNIGSSFIERSLVEVNNALEQSIFADSIAQKKGLVQSLDPRLKIVCLFAGLISVSLSHSLAAIAVFYLIFLTLVYFSKVSLTYFIGRIWIASILFTGLIALPAMFITPGPILFLFPFGLTLRANGVFSAALLILRVSTSISMASLFVLCTPWNTILQSLGVLHLPDVILLILGMTYRYIHLLLHAANDMFLSRKSRILRQLTPAEERALISASGGALLSKSLQISNDVYLAMLSRGFWYYPKTSATFKIQLKDYWAGAVALLVCAGLIWFGR